MNEEFFSVSEINKFIKDVINSGFPQVLWVCGEIQGFRQAGSGHVYLDLVEKAEGSNKITAKITAAIFANRKFQIQNILKKSENAFDLKDGIEVKFAGKVNFYEPYGTISFIIEDIDPTYTLGKLAQEKQRLIKLLKEKGVFEVNKQKELPLVPLKLGLITSDDSAAYNDFHHELQGSPYGFKLILRNTLMQGQVAEDDIIKAIGELNKLKNLDAIILTRGGGSLADLACFDGEKLAMAISQSRLPILTGIGHEINLSIADLTAHTYSKTPTALAQLLVERVDQYVQRIVELEDEVISLVEQQLVSEKQRLKTSALNLKDSTTDYLKVHQERLIGFNHILKQRPLISIKDQSRLLLDQKDELKKVLKRRIEDAQLKLTHYQKNIDFVHPANTIKRGFSIARTADGKVLKKKAQVKAGAKIKTEVVDGIIDSKVV